VDEANLAGRVASLNAAYARCIDDDRIEEWPQFFFERCLYTITSADNRRDGLEAGVIYAESRAMLRDRVSALREANIYERQRYRHIVALPWIRTVEGGEALVETPFLVARIMRDGRTDVFATGKYLDRVAADTDGTLRFRERIVVCDSARFDTLVALPL
jgi:3-phenylpropionate/cinnamic acid dioxygenase small subunit